MIWWQGLTLVILGAALGAALTVMVIAALFQRRL